MPTDLEGKKVFHCGIENLVRVEENLHLHLAKPEVNLSHVLNINGGIDMQPVRPDDAYFRQDNEHAPFPGDDRRISTYEKRMEPWSKECSKVLAIVKSIYSQAILLELKNFLAPIVLENGSRANILAVMAAVITRWGGYTPAKSTLSRNAFEATPKFTTPSSVPTIIAKLRYDILQREMWSDLRNGVDHRFSETEKKSLMVSLMDSWDELKILHTRLRGPIIQAGLTYDQIVAELLDSVRPLQEAELLSMQTSTDRCHGSTSSSMAAYGGHGGRGGGHGGRGGGYGGSYGRPVQFAGVGSSDTCYNCGKTGVNHRSRECTEPMCSWCNSVWPSDKSPGYHHNTECPHKPVKVGQSKFGATSRQSNVCGNCQSPGHDISKCFKPMCGKCGTVWKSNKSPEFHHFSKCPFPTVTQLGKRVNPFADSKSRAHMTSMR